MRMPRRPGGIALPVAVLLILVLLALVLALLLGGRTTGGLGKAVEGRMAEREVADVVFAAFQRIFSSETPDPADLALVGLSAPPPEAGGATVEFGGEVEGVAFGGSFNGGQSPWSTFQRPCAPLEPEAFGFLEGEEITVPPWHSLVFVTVQAPEQPPRTFFTLYSGLNPNAALSPDGSITMRDVLGSLVPVPGIDPGDARGRPFRLTAGKTIGVKGACEGQALSARPASEKPVSLGQGSSGGIEEGVADLQQDLEYVMKLLGQLEGIEKKLKERAKDPGCLALGTALVAATQLFQGFPLLDLGGFSFDPESATLIWNASIYVPDGVALLIPCNLEVQGDVLMGPKAALVVLGGLDVQGHLILKKESLAFAESVVVRDRVEIAYSAGPNLAIRSYLVADGDIDLQKGVRHLKKTGDWSGKVKFPFGATPNPFEEFLKKKKDGKWILVPNPVFQAFQQLQAQLLQKLLAAFDPLKRFMAATIPIPLGDEDSEFPGLLIASEEGSVRIHDTDRGAGLAGMILTKKGIVIEFPPDGSGVFTGVLIAASGNIETFFLTNLRYYPFFAAAPVADLGQLCVPTVWPLASGAVGP